MLPTQAVGIDLGTTYSCIAHLNEHGEPVTIPNQEGELATPSVVLFDDGEAIVGTEALRNALVFPNQVVQNAKRYIGDTGRKWHIDGKPYTPVDVSACILRKLLSAAQEKVGPVEQAVITVPAQFTDYQRHATVEAGHRAGLQRVDIINEPVAAALCYVLGVEGIWFTELAKEQTIMVYDLGGGTFDLSLVKYKENEVSVIASDGDLELGGIDWNAALQDAIRKQFQKEFGSNPLLDAESRQFLALEVEQAKRSLSVRPRTALACQHDGDRKTYQVELEQFERVTKGLLDRTADITKRLLSSRNMGWAHVDVVLTTGGSSRMPMVQRMLKKLSGTTLNTSLSPDQSIAHGATYYAGMLLSNDKFARSVLSQQASTRLSQVRQQSVNARGLGLLVRDLKTQKRFPHYLIKANTPLPTKAEQCFGTVVPNQQRVNLQVVESGTAPEDPHVKLGQCVIEDLDPDLPQGSPITVTIRYDEQARVHVEAVEERSGNRASAEIIRQENIVNQLAADSVEAGEVQMAKPSDSGRKPSRMPAPKSSESHVKPSPKPTRPKKRAVSPAPPVADELEDADEPIPLDENGLPINASSLSGSYATTQKRTEPKEKRRTSRRPSNRNRRRTPTRQSQPKEEIVELGDDDVVSDRPQRRKVSRKRRPTGETNRPKDGEDEFWELVD